MKEIGIRFSVSKVFDAIIVNFYYNCLKSLPNDDLMIRMWDNDVIITAVEREIRQNLTKEIWK